MIYVDGGYCKIDGIGGEIVGETIVLMQALIKLMKQQPEFAECLTEYGVETEIEFIQELHKGAKCLEK